VTAGHRRRPSAIRIGVLRVEVEDGVSALSQADTIVIPGRGVRPPPAELLAALRHASERGARMVSFCTGAYLLAGVPVDLPLVDGRLTSDPLVDGRLTSDGRNEGSATATRQDRGAVRCLPPGDRAAPGGRGSRPGRGPLTYR
jgi:hypothetical protein